MWRNPKYHDQGQHPPPRDPPAESGRRLATFDRTRRDSGNEEELRLELSEFNGSAFVSARIWYRDRDGAMRPTKKGITIRVRELSEVAEALRTAERIAQSQQTRRPAEGSKTRAFNAPSLPPMRENGGEFSEFEGE